MRIAVIDFAADSGGALSILKDFYEYVKNNDDKNEWVFLLSDNYIKETDRIKVELVDKYKQSWLKRLKFDYIDGKKIVGNLNVDCIFNLQNTAIRGIDKKQDLYVHQPLPFQNIKKFSFFKKEEFKMAVYQNLIGFLIKGSIKKCDNIIVQTNWMKKNILSDNLCAEKDINVVPPKIDIEVEKSDGIYKDNKFFYPAGEHIYKNHKIIDEAVKLLEKEGNCDLEVEFTIPKRDGYSNKINFIGNIPREDVYKKFQSEVLIFPSYIETYGLPLAECRASGGLILAADTDFSRELLAGYNNAYFFKYNDAKELADLMKKVLKNEIKKEDTEQLQISKNPDTWKSVVDIVIGTEVR